MSLTNDELLNRIRAQTDMIQHAQSVAQSAYDQVYNLNSRVTSVASEAASAMHQATSVMTQEKVNQALLQELINEIKDLREDGKLQQEQIDHIRKEMEEFKDFVNTRINQLHQMVYDNSSGTGVFRHSPYGGWEVTNTLSDGTQVITTFDDDGKPTGHTAMMKMDSCTNGAWSTINYRPVGLSEEVYKQLSCDEGVAAGGNTKETPTPKTYTKRKARPPKK